MKPTKSIQCNVVLINQSPSDYIKFSQEVSCAGDGTVIIDNVIYTPSKGTITYRETTRLPIIIKHI